MLWAGSLHWLRRWESGDLTESHCTFLVPWALKIRWHWAEALQMSVKGVKALMNECMHAWVDKNEWMHLCKGDWSSVLAFFMEITRDTRRDVSYPGTQPWSPRSGQSKRIVFMSQGRSQATRRGWKMRKGVDTHAGIRKGDKKSQRLQEAGSYSSIIDSVLEKGLPGQRSTGTFIIESDYRKTARINFRDILVMFSWVPSPEILKTKSRETKHDHQKKYVCILIISFYSKQILPLG